MLKAKGIALTAVLCRHERSLLAAIADAGLLQLSEKAGRDSHQYVIAAFEALKAELTCAMKQFISLVRRINCSMCMHIYMYLMAMFRMQLYHVEITLFQFPSAFQSLIRNAVPAMLLLCMVQDQIPFLLHLLGSPILKNMLPSDDIIHSLAKMLVQVDESNSDEISITKVR